MTVQLASGSGDVEILSTLGGLPLMGVEKLPTSEKHPISGRGSDLKKIDYIFRLVNKTFGVGRNNGTPVAVRERKTV